MKPKMLVEEEELLRILRVRFAGIISSGVHAPDGLGCALEVWSQAEGKPWTDNPTELDVPDLRPLNDAIWSSDTLRTEWMVRVMLSVIPVWRSPSRTAFVMRLALATVREVLPPALDAVGLSSAAEVCRQASTLDAARAAARAAEAAARTARAAARDAAGAAAGDAALIHACRIWIAAATDTTRR